MKTRKVDKHFYLNYLKKAEEFLKECESAIENKNWNSAVSLAIHSGICAADALCIFSLGERSAGEGHEEFIELINKINVKDINIKIRQLSSLISVKNSAEYSENLMNEKDTISAKQNAERFLSWVKGNLKQT
ncbi:MAG: HEPN domain-containing protein [Nanoarchaeota archaeon]